MRFPDTRKYADIINLPHPLSRNYARMSAADRAAQFSPFAALTGHSALICETERLTDEWVDLHEDRITELNERLQLLRDRLEEQPEVKVTYFQPDERKDGGAYLTAAGIAVQFDPLNELLLMGNGTRIPFRSITDITGEIFDAF